MVSRRGAALALLGLLVLSCRESKEAPGGEAGVEAGRGAALTPAQPIWRYRPGCSRDAQREQPIVDRDGGASRFCSYGVEFVVAAPLREITETSQSHGSLWRLVVGETQVTVETDSERSNFPHDGFAAHEIEDVSYANVDGRVARQRIGAKVRVASDLMLTDGPPEEKWRHIHVGYTCRTGECEALDRMLETVRLPFEIVQAPCEIRLDGGR